MIYIGLGRFLKETGLSNTSHSYCTENFVDKHTCIHIRIKINKIKCLLNHGLI